MLLWWSGEANYNALIHVSHIDIVVLLKTNVEHNFIGK